MIDAILGAFEAALTFLHDLLAPIPGVGDNAWGWAIIALTLIARIALLPLAIKQTRSMRAMQAIQPQMKELQKRYKVDRELMRKDPEAYKAKKQKLNEEMMALYQREGVNPAASCLPLLAQAPIFLALFWTLRYGAQEGGDIAGAPFYFFTSFVSEEAIVTGLAAPVSQSGWPGVLLILLMSGTMFLSQKQMMARNAAQMAESPMASQQKILLYVMPVFLAVVSWQFPLGILLYWVTTNFWQVAQQWIILREVRHEAETGELTKRPGGSTADAADAAEAPRRSPGASSGKSASSGAGRGKQPPNGDGGSQKDGAAQREGKQDEKKPGKKARKGNEGARGSEGNVRSDAGTSGDAAAASPSRNGAGADDAAAPGGGASVPPGDAAAPNGGGGSPGNDQPSPTTRPRDHLPHRRRGGTEGDPR